MAITRWDTAIHEASHAVIGSEIGYLIDEVSVKGAGHILGQTKFKKANDWEHLDGEMLNPHFARRFKKRKRCELAMCVGGDIGNWIDHTTKWPVVSARIPKGLFQQVLDTGYAQPGFQEGADIVHAIDLALNCWQEADVEIMNAEEHAKRILKANWKRVLPIARRLMKSGTINADSIRAMLKR